MEEGGYILQKEGQSKRRCEAKMCTSFSGSVKRELATRKALSGRIQRNGSRLIHEFRPVTIGSKLKVCEQRRNIMKVMVGRLMSRLFLFKRGELKMFSSKFSGDLPQGPWMI